MSLLDLGPLGYRTVLYCTVSNMQVSLLVVYIGTRKMVTLQRGVRHDQHVLVYMGVRYDVASAPKNCGGRQGWGGTKSSCTHRLSVSLF